MFQEKITQRTFIFIKKKEGRSLVFESIQFVIIMIMIIVIIKSPAFYLFRLRFIITEINLVPALIVV